MFLSLDYETSHLDSNVGAPVSIGVALFDEDGDVVDTFHRIFSPPMKDGKITRCYDIVALQISGITWKQILAGDPIAKVMGELAEWANDHDAKHMPVVAFNAPFDYAWFSACMFLGGSWNQHLRKFEGFKPPLLGTWQCARMLAVDQLELDRYDLNGVAAHFGLSRDGEKHGAAEDAILAGKVYHRLTQKENSQKV